MTKLHVLDAHLAAGNRWLKELMENLELDMPDQARALHALRAGLHAIRDRLPTNEVIDLGAQLPTLLRGLYYEGWSPDVSPGRIRTRAAMIARVKRELGKDTSIDPVDVLRAVIHLIVEHVSNGEIHDILSTLPGPIAELWYELTGHAIADPSPPTRARPAQRTGYSR
jgi:uncharacterized protein (DUF2267 family)